MQSLCQKLVIYLLQSEIGDVPSGSEALNTKYYPVLSFGTPYMGPGTGLWAGPEGTSPAERTWDQTWDQRLGYLPIAKQTDTSKSIT